MKFHWSNLGNARLNNDEELIYPSIHSSIHLVGFFSVSSVIVHTVNLTEEKVVSLVFQTWNRGTLLLMEHLLISYKQQHSMDPSLGDDVMWYLLRLLTRNQITQILQQM